ncbi:hypothetical protein AGRA3207_002061 [Actinomadura graeca]|uniref:Uncharacterized protein n=1 Tax=Actinomadura graeca TaxID=2750812 RepID=A0ABX8QRA1_9ACTN|nr:hypothetical protein [Actinomadura graeca]QXJ21226.1 hypothetical protein AGRA3207_002061 [Actinomadura graeca]
MQVEQAAELAERIAVVVDAQVRLDPVRGVRAGTGGDDAQRGETVRAVAG